MINTTININDNNTNDNNTSDANPVLPLLPFSRIITALTYLPIVPND